MGAARRAGHPDPRRASDPLAMFEAVFKSVFKSVLEEAISHPY